VKFYVDILSTSLSSRRGFWHTEHRSPVCWSKWRQTSFCALSGHQSSNSPDLNPISYAGGQHSQPACRPHRQLISHANKNSVAVNETLKDWDQTTVQKNLWAYEGQFFCREKIKTHGHCTVLIINLKWCTLLSLYNVCSYCTVPTHQSSSHTKKHHNNYVPHNDFFFIWYSRRICCK